MSYILDALKRAERERGAAKVPTLATVHESERPPRFQFPMVVIAAVFLLAVGAGLSWILFHSPNGTPEASPDIAQREPGTEPATRENPIPAVGMQDGRILPSSLPQSRVPDSGSPLHVENSPPKTGTAKPTGSMSAMPAAAEKPGSDKADMQASAPAPEAGSRLDEVENSPGSSRNRFVPESSANASSQEFSPPPGETGSRSAVLEEAMKTMTISIHRYSENPSDRLVFINGRKYVEGEYVEGRFLLESITREGAVLSYEGVRAPLKASAY